MCPSDDEEFYLPLRAAGVSEADLTLMFKTNPAFLVNLK